MPYFMYRLMIGHVQVVTTVLLVESPINAWTSGIAVKWGAGEKFPIMEYVMNGDAQI
jgi:hypothetical protein